MTPSKVLSLLCRPASRPWLLLACVPLLYLPYLIKWKLGLTSDTAVPYLMARSILAGELPLHYWGQAYWGALDIYVTAAIMAVFGKDPVFLSGIVPLRKKE